MMAAGGGMGNSFFSLLLFFTHPSIIGPHYELWQQMLLTYM